MVGGVPMISISLSLNLWTERLMTFDSNFDFVLTIMGKLMEVLHYTLIFTYLERGVSLDII